MFHTLGICHVPRQWRSGTEDLEEDLLIQILECNGVDLHSTTSVHTCLQEARTVGYMEEKLNTEMLTDTWGTILLALLPEEDHRWTAILEDILPITENHRPRWIETGSPDLHILIYTGILHLAIEEVTHIALEVRQGGLLIWIIEFRLPIEGILTFIILIIVGPGLQGTTMESHPGGNLLDTVLRYRKLHYHQVAVNERRIHEVISIKCFLILYKDLIDHEITRMCYGLRLMRRRNKSCHSLRMS